MKDFVSKVTFGFLMAQLLPGAVVVFAITCAMKVDLGKSDATLSQLLLHAGECWFKLTLTTIAFLFMAVAIGMLIHGFNWTVLAWLEHIQKEKGWESVRGDLYWHTLPVWLQLIISPCVMIVEILWLLSAKKLVYVIMDENVSRIRPDKMQQFTFLQEFYLHFGQFYAHMAYAFLITTICSLIWCINNWGSASLGIVFFFYFFTSTFFLLGRIQLGSLFGAEEELAKDGKSAE